MVASRGRTDSCHCDDGDAHECGEQGLVVGSTVGCLDHSLQVSVTQTGIGVGGSRGPGHEIGGILIQVESPALCQWPGDAARDRFRDRSPQEGGVDRGFPEGGLLGQVAVVEADDGPAGDACVLRLANERGGRRVGGIGSRRSAEDVAAVMVRTKAGKARVRACRMELVRSVGAGQEGRQIASDLVGILAVEGVGRIGVETDGRAP